MNNLNEREKEFIEQVISFSQYEPGMLNDFYDYWTEPNKSKTKMRFELERTWDTKRRLTTWFKNDKKWTKNASINKGKATGAHQLLEELRANFKPE